MICRLLDGQALTNEAIREKLPIKRIQYLRFNRCWLQGCPFVYSSRINTNNKSTPCTIYLFRHTLRVLDFIVKIRTHGKDTLFCKPKAWTVNHAWRETHSLIGFCLAQPTEYICRPKARKGPNRKSEEGYLPSPPTSFYFFIRSVSLPLISVLRQVHGNVVCFLSRQLANARTWSGIASTIPWLHLGLGLGPYKSCPYTNTCPQSVPGGRRIPIQRHSRRWIVGINNHKDSLNSRFDSII